MVICSQYSKKLFLNSNNVCFHTKKERKKNDKDFMTPPKCSNPPCIVPENLFPKRIAHWLQASTSSQITRVGEGTTQQTDLVVPPYKMPQGVGINKLFTKQTCSSFVKEKSCISPARSIAALIGVNFRITLVLTEIIFVVLKLVSGPSS